jgi:DNA repair exonuclease SbcCD nuclease subunit
MKPFGIVSDQHFHLWSAFSTTLPNGINSRLQASLDELRRCANEVRAVGGNLIINAGDTFHVRGSVSPEVLNPVMDLHQELINDGFEIVIISGNHDLSSRDSNRLSSAVTALEGVGCKVVHEATNDCDVAFIPWMNNVNDLKDYIDHIYCGNRQQQDLIIHAPVDGVIAGLPDHGLTADWLGEQGFRRVFSGHYHAHKDFGNGVYSIGSTTHLTWSDVGSKAGFLIVDDNEVKWFKSHAPEFIDLTDDVEPDDVPFLVDGNFVRARVTTSKTAEINKLREWLIDCGAKGVVIQTVKQSTNTRSTAPTSISAGASLEVSIADYIKTQSFDHADDVQIEAQKILTELEVKI